MTLKEKLAKAKTRIILRDPFFASLLLGFPMVENAEKKDISVDGTKIEYNPEYLEKQDIDDIAGLLVHEIAHIASFHHLRRNDRDNAQWNKAADYAINSILSKSNYKLPAGALIDKRYDNMSAEEIFSLLPAPKPDEKPAPGEVNDSPAKTETEKGQQEAELKQKILLAQQAAKAHGTLSDGLKSFIADIIEPRQNWKEILSRFICDTAKNDYSFKRPNARFIQTGFYLPSLYSEEPGNIILIVDTSASIEEDLLQEFATELKEVAETMKKEIKVIYVDTKFQGIETIEPDAPLNITPIGRGGTDFRPGFEYINENDLQPRAVIYFTDGECNLFPEIAPEYPVLWAKYGNYKRFNPPFGETIHF